MKRPGPRDTRGESAPLSRRVPAGAADADFAWPPSAEDLEGCGIVRLPDETASVPDVSVFVRLSDLLPPPTSTSPVTHDAPTTTTHVGRSRHWGVERPAESYPFSVDGDDPAATRSAAGETWRAAMALAAGLSLAVLSYTQFRAMRGDIPAAVVAEAAVALSDVRSGPEPVMDPPTVAMDVEATPTGTALALDRRRGENDRPIGSTVAHEPVRSALSAIISRVRDDLPTVELVTPAPSAPVESRDRVDAVAEVRPPVAAPVETVDRPASPTPVAMAAVHAVPVHMASVPGEEDHIRAALTRWRTAYSELDANAAREVWPSVDARALERAFQALKSQDLRFDRCDLTVHGGSAQAACTGRAVYVPRVGNQSPRATAREWTFELKKRDERWTIASARAS
jgi:hypothetical protein